MSFRIYLEILLAALVSGAACSLAGFILSNLRLTFLGVTMSHAAMAGAVYGRLWGLPVFPPAFLAALAGSFSIGALADRSRLDSNLVMGIVFSLSMGLAFLGIGMASGSRSELLGLIWGSILLIPRSDLILLALIGGLFFLFVLVMDKEIKAVLFSRTIAAASGAPERLVTYCLLIGCAAVITASLETIGGLLLFALLTNPVAAAARLFKSYRACMIGSAALGAACTVAGLALSLAFSLPAGAAIVLVSGALFGFTLFMRPE